MTAQPSGGDDRASGERDGFPTQRTIDESIVLGGAQQREAASGADEGAEPERRPAEGAAVFVPNDQAARHRWRRGQIRRGVVGFLVGAFTLLLPVTFATAWGHNAVLDNDGWESIVNPIAADPVVQAAVGLAVTDQIFSALHPEQRVAAVLPPKAAFLAGPITNGMKGYVQGAVVKIVQSQQFQALWREANRFAHGQLVSVLEGKSKAVHTTDGKVVLDLVPVLNDTLQHLQGFVSGVVGKPVKLPTISGDELPSAACEKIAKALGRPLPTTCGQIVLFRASSLAQAQRAVRAFNRLVILLLVLTPVVAALALWLSPRKRRTLLQLSVGGLIGLVVERRLTSWQQAKLEAGGAPEYRAARAAIIGHVLHDFYFFSAWILVVLLVVFLAALVTGPYPWAQSLRARINPVVGTIGAATRSTVGGSRVDAITAWCRAHLDVLRVGGIAVALIVLLAASLSFVGIVIVVGLLVVYELALTRLGHTARPPHAPPPPVLQ